MRGSILRIALISSAALVLALLLLWGPLQHRLTVKAYFANAMALRVGAPVRLAAVDVGIVKSVRARPEVKDAPVEVILSLKTAKELRIPNDSTVSLETAGLLGETFVEIDSRSATGPPIQSGGVLKAAPIVSLTSEQMLEKFAAALNLNTEQTLAKIEAVLKEQLRVRERKVRGKERL